MAVIGIGVDLVDIVRLSTVLDRTPGMADRVFSAAELAYAGPSTDVGMRRLAARFAAKEAVSKALGAESTVRWREVEVVSADGCRPELRLTGETAALAARAGITTWHLSLTHEGNLAMAYVVAES
ncbi:MAG TPA: holo-ACP synthase [Mycobacteriales bacterium]|jgi:holo-[acyl-carrier protein] synthase|nr:holo-ACP synthase [Mycobacteriales bacterium]